MYSPSLSGPRDGPRVAAVQGALGRWAERLWSGAQFATVSQPALPTGYPALDAELPGGGWPASGLTELLLAAYRRPARSDIDVSQHVQLPPLASIKVFPIDEDEAAAKRGEFIKRWQALVAAAGQYDHAFPAPVPLQWKCRLHILRSFFSFVIV